MNHLLLRSDAGQRCITLNLSCHTMVLEFFGHTEAAISEPGATQAKTGFSALLYIISRVEAAEALKSGSVEGLVHFG